MAEITNEQKLYVLLNCTPSMSEYESDIWYVVHSRVSPDDNWCKDVAKVLAVTGYLTHGWAFSGNDSREVWSITEDGRKQIPILWNGCELKRQHEEEKENEIEKSKFKNRHGSIAEIIKIILAACIGALIDRVVDLLFEK